MTSIVVVVVLALIIGFAVDLLLFFAHEE